MKMWSEEKKEYWESAKRRLAALNSSFEKSEGLFSGERPSGDPNAAADEERKTMLRETRGLQYELTEFFMITE